MKSPEQTSSTLLGKRNGKREVVTEEKTSQQSNSGLNDQSTSEKGTAQSEKAADQQKRVTQFFKSSVTGKSIDDQVKLKGRLHAESLWRDEVPPRMLEDKQNIFDIIMPWVQEKADEEKAARDKGKKKITGKQSTLAGFMNKSGTPKGGFGSNNGGPKARSYSDDEEEEIAKEHSKVHKMLEVETFDFKFLDKVVNPKGGYKQVEKKLEKVQAVLINPRWRHIKDYYEVLKQASTFSTELKGTVQAVQEEEQKAEAEGGDQPEKKGRRKKSTPKTNLFRKDVEDDDEDKTGAFKGITMKEFAKITIPKSVMQDGMLFVWVEKERINDVVLHFEAQGFAYVENMCWVMLDESKRREVERYHTVDATPAFVKKEYPFLRKSKQTLLMFRRTEDLKHATKLELRHQRTGDVVFDFIDPNNPFKKPEYYIYKLIETLLPKAMASKKNPGIKLVEFWSQDDTPRKGWLKLCDLKN